MRRESREGKGRKVNGEEGVVSRDETIGNRGRQRSRRKEKSEGWDECS
jgi:hypothetical protein